MIRLQVLVNGRTVCTAGVDEVGSLGAFVEARPLIAIHRWENGVKSIIYPLGEDVHEACELEVTAPPPDGNEEEHLEWAKMVLKPGDEVTIRVLGAGESDPPVLKNPFEDD